MRIVLKNIGQRYNREVIFKGINVELIPGERYAVTGSNGSGKSTLLKILCGKSIPAEGEIDFYSSRSEPIPIDAVYKHIGICAPYLNLYEEFTLDELIAFHFKFKQPVSGVSLADIPEKLQLRKQRNKKIENFSSGMKQRVKLGLAALSNTSALFLDEPFSNLDDKGQLHMRALIDEYGTGRLIAVCTNSNERELSLCTQTIDVESYK